MWKVEVEMLKPMQKKDHSADSFADNGLVLQLVNLHLLQKNALDLHKAMTSKWSAMAHVV